MTVEITPSGSAADLARQLLTVAEALDGFTVNDVKTTTHGPQGLAFLVPDELHEAWLEAFMPKPAEPEPEPKPRAAKKAAAKGKAED